MLKKISLLVLLSAVIVSSVKPLSTDSVFEYVKSDVFLNSKKRLALKIVFISLAVVFCKRAFAIIDERIKEEKNIDENNLFVEGFSRMLKQEGLETNDIDKLYCHRSLAQKWLNKKSLYIALDMTLALLFGCGASILANLEGLIKGTDQYPLKTIYIHL